MVCLFKFLRGRDMAISSLSECLYFVFEKHLFTGCRLLRAPELPPHCLLLSTLALEKLAVGLPSTFWCYHTFSPLAHFKGLGLGVLYLALLCVDLCLYLFLYIWDSVGFFKLWLMCLLSSALSRASLGSWLALTRPFSHISHLSALWANFWILSFHLSPSSLHPDRRVSLWVS